MNLITDFLENSFEIKSKKLNTLVIEDRKYFTRFLEELIQNSNKASESIEIIENNKQLNFSKSVEIIFDLFSLEANGSSILKRLYLELEEDLNSQEMYTRKLELESDLASFIDDIIYRSRFSLVSNDIDYNVFFKSFSIKFDYDGSSILDRLVEYIKVSSELLNKKLFIIVNLDSFLNDDDLIELNNFLCYNEIKVLALQNSITRSVKSCENLRIIDKDLCEI